jgi:hypothetical protein
MDLSRLRKKYETILELRLHHVSTWRGASDPKDAVRALASEFPGALRDLDALHLAEVHDRIEALVAAELDPINMKPWMIAELTFYDAMRGVLAAKTWLKKRHEVDDALREAFSREAPALPYGEEARTWQRDLHLVARPPRGRLVPLALARVARDLEVSEPEADALVFRHPGKEARRVTRDRKAPHTG